MVCIENALRLAFIVGKAAVTIPPVHRTSLALRWALMLINSPGNPPRVAYREPRARTLKEGDKYSPGVGAGVTF
jgi:hypothetical protein